MGFDIWFILKGFSLSSLNIFCGVNIRILIKSFFLPAEHYVCTLCDNARSATFLCVNPVLMLNIFSIITILFDHERIYTNGKDIESDKVLTLNNVSLRNPVLCCGDKVKLIAVHMAQQWRIQGGALGTHPPISVQFLTCSCSFRQEFCQISGWHSHSRSRHPPLPLGNPLSSTGQFVE